jgi:hypothetical protein
MKIKPGRKIVRLAMRCYEMMKSPSMTLGTPNGDLDHGYASGERLGIYRAEVAVCSAPHPMAGDLDSAANPNRRPTATRILVTLSHLGLWFEQTQILSVIVHLRTIIVIMVT